MKPLKLPSIVVALLFALTGCAGSGDSTNNSPVSSFHWAIDYSTDSGNPSLIVGRTAQEIPSSEIPLVSFIGADSLDCNFFYFDTMLDGIVLETTEGEVYGKIFGNSFVPPEQLSLKCDNELGELNTVSFQPQPVDDFSIGNGLTGFFWFDEPVHILYLVLDEWLFSEPPLLLTNFHPGDPYHFTVGDFGQVMIEGVLRQAIPILVNTQGEFSPADFAAAFNRILHKPLDQKALDVFPITAEEYVNPPEGPPTSPYLICSPEPGTAAPEGTSETSLMVLGAGLFQPSGEIMAGETLSVMFGEDVTGAYIYSNFLIPLPLEGATVVTGLQGAYVLVTCSEFGQDTVDDGCGAIFTYAFDGGATSCLTFYTQP